MTRSALLLLGAAGVLLGFAAEWAAFDWDDPRHWIPDLAVGWSFIACGLAGRWRRPDSGTGPLMVAVGFTWFLGNFAAVDVPPIAWLATHALYLHRGPLIHCVLSFPSGRLSSGLDRAAAAVGTSPPSHPDPGGRFATLSSEALLVAVAVRGYVAAIWLRPTAACVGVGGVRRGITVGIVLLRGRPAPARRSRQVTQRGRPPRLTRECWCAVASVFSIGRLRRDGEAGGAGPTWWSSWPSRCRGRCGTPLGRTGGPDPPGGDSGCPSGGHRTPGSPFDVPRPGTGRAVTPFEVDAVRSPSSRTTAAGRSRTSQSIGSAAGGRL